jgi:LysR family glycine cleavage system transcriptional activator
MNRLPPLVAFRALEAVVRLGSYSRAAAELHVTHGAVSHQIRSLEEELGTVLFQRRGNGMQPLPAARKLAVSVNAALALLDRAMEEADARRSFDPLVMSVEQGFARRWLVSRIEALRDATGGGDLDIRLENRMADFVGDGVDVAIRFGDGNWPGFEVTRLFRVRFFPVCSPLLLNGRILDRAMQLLEFPLLRHTHPLWGWPSWFRALGLPPPPDRGFRFDDSSLMLEAAAEGAGIALARSNLAQAELKSGRLIRPLPDEVESALGYFIVWRADARRLARILLLRDWLLRECPSQEGSADAAHVPPPPPAR